MFLILISLDGAVPAPVSPRVYRVNYEARSGPHVPNGQMQFPGSFNSQDGFLEPHNDVARLANRFIVVRWRMTTLLDARHNYSDATGNLFDEIDLESRRRDIISWITGLGDPERTYSDEEIVMITRAVLTAEQSMGILENRVRSIEI
mgnify:CR=1 FL=1